ncbi:hypothetical protein [Paenibacillus caui]|uniref:hypothetical protein n=1 Tax=Paenibacillus caui TaxID=2873927 RepID=UPI001CA7B87F|nr:hypothetical protein [Paenibacillus caui]
MRILIVSGGFHRMMLDYLTKKLEVVNPNALALRDLLDYLHEANPAVEGVVVTDGAFSQQQEQDRDHLSMGLKWLSTNRGPGVPVYLITRDPMKPQELEALTQQYENFKILVSDAVRVPVHVFQEAFDALGSKGNRIHKQQQQRAREQRNDDSKGEKRRSFFDRFRSRPPNEAQDSATDRLTKELANISRGISRVVAITGHRGSGLTSTVVNLANEASKRGLSTMIIDMDAEYRSTNMYFGRFHEQSNKYDEMSASLIRTLARPQDYMTTAFSIKDNLWLTALGYSFQDRKLMEQFYTSDKLVGLISLLRTKFNLVLLDLPLDLFKAFKETMIHIDSFGLCVPNNLYAVLSTIRNVEVVLDQEKAAYLNAKSKVIVTKYNDRSRFQDALFTPDKVSEVLTSGLSDIFRYDMSMAGYVPYSSGFDSQIETEIALTNSAAEYEQAFGNMLLRLMEGA